MNLKEYIIQKGGITTSFKAFNEYLIKDKLVYNSLNKLLIRYAEINFKEFLNITEFQYLRSILHNDKAIKKGNYFKEISMLYSLSNGKISDVTGMFRDKYNEFKNRKNTSLLVDCTPYIVAADFKNKNGEGAFEAVNNLPNGEKSITTWETKIDKEIQIGFVLEKSNDNYKITKNRHVLSFVKEKDR